jgi:2,3-bisphosphoglycerate-independent phosphoglycerate mutase
LEKVDKERSVELLDWKYMLLVGDGMGDYPLAELNGRTPLEAAHTPNMDRLAGCGVMGLVRTIPEGMEPGSDVANMSLLGYDPRQYHTGRAPLEAASMNVQLAPDEVALRCNLVTLVANDLGAITMGDYSAGHISTSEAHQLVAGLQSAVSDLPLRLYPGVSYRHLLVWSGGRVDLDTTPPHDITGEQVAGYQRVYQEEQVLLAFINRAHDILAEHPVNKARKADGKRPANAVWLWGQGKAPSMPTLQERYGLSGVMISAVDLLKGLGVYAGLTPVAVPGATGYLDTNYAGKVAAALQALSTGNFVYMHIEAPDEAGHEGSLAKKIQAIEAFDAQVVGPVVAGAKVFPNVRVVVVTDHLTPISKRTHVDDPVPFLLIKDLHEDLRAVPSSVAAFCERTAKGSSQSLVDGVALFEAFVGAS